MKRLLVIVFIAAAIFVGVGLYQGWLGGSTTNAAGQRTFSLTWNSEKFKGDMGKLSDKAKSMGKGLVAKVRGKGKDVGENQREFSGSVKSIDAENRLVTLTVDGDDMQIPYPESVDVAGLEGKQVIAAVDVTDEGVILRAVKADEAK